jgi:hypothetical protein
MKRLICFALAAILSCQPLIGCSSWSAQTRPPQEIVQERHPDKVRVRLGDGRELVLEKPSIVSDSLVGGDPTLSGWIQSSSSASDSSEGIQGLPRQSILEPMGVPVSSINQLAIRKVSASKTVGLVFGVVVGLAAIATIAFVEECNRTGCFE